MASRKKKGLPKRLFQHIKPAPIPPGFGVVQRPVNAEKMSDALERLVAPYRDETEDADSLRSLLRFGILAWNVALLPEDLWADKLDKFLANIAGKEEQAELRPFVLALIQRKLELFPDNRRIIYSVEVTDTNRKFHLSVASSVEPAPPGYPKG